MSSSVRTIFEKVSHPFVDAYDLADLDAAVNRTAKYLRKKGMLHLRAKTIVPICDAILSVPALDPRYKKRNPVKYLTNQILHMSEVTALIEEAVLGTERPTSSRA